MLNDQQAAELISQSLSGRLSTEEKSVVDEHLTHNPRSQAFARLSQMIQDSVSGVGALAATGDPSVAPGLTPQAKDRLRDSIRQASTRAKAAEEDTRDGDGQEVNLADTPRTMTTGQASPWPAASANRQLVSRFSLLRKLGEGGLGTVWLARDERLKRTVAIKEMNATAAEDPKAWQRFHREAEITGYLEHPNVVPIYQFGSDPKSGLPFYAMRFLGKSTLANAIEEFHEMKECGEQCYVAFFRLLSAFMGVCQAIAYAHSRGVIHRDLKPENVALDTFGQVIVLDWGLAKLTAEAELRLPLGQGPAALEGEVSHTMAGEIIGTPLYMAPEQAAGDLDRVDEQTDIYGLGAILYAILTGKAPHQNTKEASKGGGGVTELLQTIADTEPPWPREMHTKIPAELDEICRKAMSRRSSRRHESAAALADEVQAWLAGHNEKREKYENIRLEGRDVRGALVSCVRDLGTNARFMAHLPPIQGIIGVDSDQSDESLSTWRERLTTIFKGLLHANSNFHAVTFIKMADNEASELVRVERHSTESATVRSVPLSRLRKANAPEFFTRTMQQKPDEIYAGLLHEFGGVDANEGTACAGKQANFLAAGVPVFDDATEEPFGVVVVEAKLGRIFQDVMTQRQPVSDELLIVNDDNSVIAQWSRDVAGSKPLVGKDASQEVDRWSEVEEQIELGEDYMDESSRDLFATSLQLCGAGDKLTIVLRTS